ncbi:YihY/virulence factor BrkB family protein [Alkalibacter mobilis]|uniref:YihY/virulence factor BrkB family protein n=1 Tax=Alkalibacter mobilis TaxID=2787712 RepID=UPI00189C9313|nr:YihY/virulence factor BrkB family protein [Alkalibacter mobilis]MBF7096048.1 YihY/virulence factor BrkB family protein [Alkalibacter mobilis]
MSISKPKEFILLFMKRIDQNNLIAYAYQLTYSLLLALFPFLIFLFTLVGYINLDSGEILSAIQNSLPENIFSLLSSIVIDIVDKQRTGLMSLSVFLAVYSSSGGFRAFMKGTNQALGIQDDRNVLVKFLLSIFWVIIFATTILLSLLGIVFGRQIISLITSYFPVLPLENIISFLRIVLPIAFLFLMILNFYIFVPAKRVKFRFAFPGAIFSTLSWVAFTFAFQYYVDNYANYSRFYGALGAVIALMLWLLLTSIILLLGVEFNAVLIELKKIDDPYMKPFTEFLNHIR